MALQSVPILVCCTAWNCVISTLPPGSLSILPPFSLVELVFIFVFIFVSFFSLINHFFFNCISFIYLFGGQYRVHTITTAETNGLLFREHGVMIVNDISRCVFTGLCMKNQRGNHKITCCNY